MAAIGPTLPTWALQQVGNYRGYTGRSANVVAKATPDPKPPSGFRTGALSGSPGHKRLALDALSIASSLFAHAVRHLPSTPLLRCLEIPRVWRRLILARRHQVAVSRQEVVLLANNHVVVALGAVIFRPQYVALVPEGFEHRPRPRQRMINRRDLDAQEAGIGLVEEKPLLDDTLVVAVQENPGIFVRSGPLEVAGFDFEHVIFAVAVLVDPLADRVSHIGGFLVGGEAAAIRVDTARHVSFTIDVGDRRQDDQFERPRPRHDARHAGSDAAHPGIVALSSTRLVGDARLQTSLVLGNQWRLLSESWTLGLIPLRADAGRSSPLTGPVGILRIIERCDRANHEHPFGRDHEGGKRAV